MKESVKGVSGSTSMPSMMQGSLRGFQFLLSQMVAPTAADIGGKAAISQ